MNNSNGIEAVESSYECRAVAAVADRLSVHNFRSHERLSSSELQRLNKLISEEEIGDRKPSQFLRHIHSPVGAIVMQDNLRWIIWLQRLWSTVRAIFKTQLELKIDN
ncbi:hypothetical protein J6590_100403 [Homalodisca vitripennis]|nr:hypothetical protein J6590_100403 [Homalodisca vitripennis]